MKRVNTLLIICSLTLSCFAQTQQGYVKTLGRANQKGTALSGVSVRVKGEHNPVLSRTDGTFSILMAGKKNGDAYSLQQVQKTGFELNETGIIGRQFALSDKVPLTIVMVSKDQLQADKQRIEDKAFQVAEKNYKEKQALLEKQKEENAITIEQYRQQIQDLQDKFDKYQSLIDGLANHYAHVDYDDLDEKEREINICIENGDLERAESLLNQLGIQQRITNIEQRLAAGQSLMDEATQDLAAVLKQQERDAEHLYQLHTIALANFDRDKAKLYIEIRAALDTTNVRWQIDAGEFFCEHTIDLNVALAYLQRAQRYSEPEGMEMAECLNDIAVIYLMKGKMDNAVDLAEKSLDMRKKLFGENHSSVGIAYNTFGVCMEVLGNYEKSINCHQKSLEIRRTIFGEQSVQTVTAYYNIVACLFRQRKFEQALDYLKKAKPLAEALTGIEMLRMKATIYDAIASVLQGIADRDKKPTPPQVMEYHREVLNMYLEMYGENNSRTAYSFHNLGTCYIYNLTQNIMENDTVLTVNRDDLLTGINLLKKSLEIKRLFMNENHKSINDTKQLLGLAGKDCYVLGVRNQEKNNSDKMEFYYTMCYEVLSIVNEKDDYPVMTNACMGIGAVYQSKGSYEEAINYYKKALDLSLATDEKSQVDLLLQSIHVAYTEWLKVDPNNKNIKKDYQQFKTQINN